MRIRTGILTVAILLLQSALAPSLFAHGLHTGSGGPGLGHVAIHALQLVALMAAGWWLAGIARHAQPGRRRR